MGFCWIALPLQRKPIFSRFGGAGWPLIRALFQVCISVCVFIRFSMISGGTLTPFGLPWAPHLLPQEHLCQDRCKGRLQGPKKSFLRAFWVPFWWILADISDDLGCILNTPFLGILFVFITYFWGIHRVFFCYSLSVLELFSKYFLGIA